jgi:ArsR family transcriptional regulator, lead/cadmium/zinc/bismuth-responsive transcriptional repressor
MKMCSFVVSVRCEPAFGGPAIPAGRGGADRHVAARIRGFNLFHTMTADPQFAVDDRIVPVADLFRLLGDPTRLRIVLACAQERRAVGAIAEVLGLSQSLVSHHLRLLRAARVVRAERVGKQVFYVAADRHISDMLADMLEHVAEPISDLPRDER